MFRDPARLQNRVLASRSMAGCMAALRRLQGSKAIMISEETDTLETMRRRGAGPPGGGGGASSTGSTSCPPGCCGPVGGIARFRRGPGAVWQGMAGTMRLEIEPVVN
jgi:hypothetical protein